MNIGYFDRAQVREDGSKGLISGSIRFPFAFPEKAVLLPVSEDRIMRYPSSPRYEIYAANSNLNMGACFEKTSKAGAKYYSVVFESPIFEGGKAYASMFGVQDKNNPERLFELVWNAPKPRGKETPAQEGASADNSNLNNETIPF